jgi:hypothetical protein
VWYLPADSRLPHRACSLNRELSKRVEFIGSAVASAAGGLLCSSSGIYSVIK